MDKMEVIKTNNIREMIYEIRGKQVMLDSDVALKMSIEIVDEFIDFGYS